MAIPIAQELNQFITFKTPTGARNAVSGVAATLTTVLSVWAKITDLGGDVEQTEQGDHAFRNRYEIWTRYSASITAFQQIVWGSKTLVITSPPQKVVDANNRWWSVLQAEYVTEES